MEPLLTDSKELLLYWIKERYDILLKRENGVAKPWSEDEVFQRTYFCNVRREDDRVTRWIRNYYSPRVDDRMFEYNIILSRFLNWPPTLEKIGYATRHTPDDLLAMLEGFAGEGKVWGGAYVITTHGIPMKKDRYLTHRVLEGVSTRVDLLKRYTTCQGIGLYLQEFEGIGSFLSGQVVADLKNTAGHPLNSAEDKDTFVTPGPGSIRGLGWYHYGDHTKVSESMFMEHFKALRSQVDREWPEGVPVIDNQDLQNCLCEYDKYMRVRNGTGRSKRSYNGY